jgi:hypothetical protein
MVTNKITAKEARSIAFGPIDEALDYAYDMIRKAAEAGKLSTSLQTEFWVREGYSGTDAWKSAKAELEAAGFAVEFYYSERQFVDMYTIVRWSDAK